MKHLEKAILERAKQELREEKSKQPEGFCLMQYQDMETEEIEWIWNSRQYITPFCITSHDGKREMQHIRWEEDAYCPHWIPRPGDRIFVDVTIESAREWRTRYVNMYWEEGKMMERWASKEEAIEELAEADAKEFGGHAPRIITVGKEGYKP